MTRVILYIATSTDGFIADKDGGVDWLPHPTDDSDELGYQALMEKISIVVMGSKSYLQILGFGDWPWPGKLTYVFTGQDLTSERDDIFFVRQDVQHFMEPFGVENIWLLGGAALIESFAEKNLIDECVITIIPKTLGEGIKLQLPYEDFTLKQTKHCSNDIVQHIYERSARQSMPMVPDAS